MGIAWRVGGLVGRTAAEGSRRPFEGLLGCGWYVGSLEGGSSVVGGVA